jgi:hypothetical protein
MKKETDYKKQIRELQSALAIERHKNSAMGKGLIPKEYLQEYARIQIENDRISESELMVQVKIDSKAYDQSERTCFLEGAETVLRQLRYRPITFEEALILLDWEVDKPKFTYRVSNPYTAITTTKTTPSTLTFTTNSELEDK